MTHKWKVRQRKLFDNFSRDPFFFFFSDGTQGCNGWWFYVVLVSYWNESRQRRTDFIRKSPLSNLAQPQCKFICPGYTAGWAELVSLAQPSKLHQRLSNTFIGRSEVQIKANKDLDKGLAWCLWVHYQTISVCGIAVPCQNTWPKFWLHCGDEYAYSTPHPYATLVP